MELEKEKEFYIGQMVIYMKEILKEDKKLEIINKMKKLSYDRIDEYNSLDEELHKLNTNDKFDFIEEIKIKKQNVSENLLKAEELLKKLQEKKSGMNEHTKELKNKIVMNVIKVKMKLKKIIYIVANVINFYVIYA